jgi:hypothetical protein
MVFFGEDKLPCGIGKEQVTFPILNRYSLERQSSVLSVAFPSGAFVQGFGRNPNLITLLSYSTVLRSFEQYTKWND